MVRSLLLHIVERFQFRRYLTVVAVIQITGPRRFGRRRQTQQTLLTQLTLLNWLSLLSWLKLLSLLSGL